MEKSFDLGSVLRKHQISHKYNPIQSENVASRVHRRLENNIKHRKSARLTGYDSIRNLPQPCPGPVAEPEQNIPDRRRQQLEKWKEEKEKKKQLAAKNKKKPFIVASSKPINPLKYEPVPKYEPSSSGCVTRSQSARNKKKEKVQSSIQINSFAPKNARFRAPESIIQKKVPKLAPVTKDKKNVSSYTFNPVLPTIKPATIQRSHAYNRIAAESKQARITARGTKAKIAKPVSKLEKQKVVQTSSSSENEPSLMQTSGSSSDVDLTAKLVSSSSEENSNFHSSTDNFSLKSLQSLPSSSSTESETEKLSPGNVTRKSIIPSAVKSNSSPYKSTRKSNQGKIMHTPYISVPKSESSSEEKLRSPKSPTDTLMTPQQVSEGPLKTSPCVTMSRGKDNARKEMLKKLGDGCFEEDESNMSDVDYFQQQLTSEIARMTNICEVWDTIHQQVALPDPVQELVLAAVGQARLLMSQKMQQFASLVQRCRHPQPNTPLVTPADLAGFWDMVFMQVENVDMRFKKLEELKARNWVEEKAAAPRPTRVRPAPAPQRPRAAAPAPVSRLRDMIAQARKAKSQKQSEEVHEPSLGVPSEEKTFDGGYFQVRSPARSPVPRTPVQRDSRSLLKAVLSSEAEKASASKKSASYAMMHASVLGKNVDCSIVGVEPLPQTPIPNLAATPGRSILKPMQEKSVKSNHKYIRKVVFDQSGNEADLNPFSDLINSNTSDNSDTKSKELSAESEKDSNEIDLINFKLDRKGIEEEKGNSKSEKTLIRQNAILSPEDTQVIPRIMTRKMRKSMQSPMPLESPKLRINTRKTKNLSQQTEENIPNETPKSEKAKRSTRKSVLKEVEENVLEDIPNLDLKTPRAEKSSKRSTRKSTLPEMEHSTPKVVTTPKSVKRSTRKKILTEVESNVENPTPRRSTRNKKTDLPEMLALA